MTLDVTRNVLLSCTGSLTSFCRETPKSLQNMALIVSLDMYVCYMSHIHGHGS